MPTSDSSTISPSPRPFLASVARAYADRYEDMSDLCFVFPNKRSGTFFLKHLSGALGDRTLLAPEVLGIDEFMERVSGLRITSRVDAIFRLYKIYRSLRGADGFITSPDDALDFDRFAPWAETVLSDFDETDKYAAPPEALFANVRDYRGIAANFLSEEQLDVIERYFGYRPSSGDVSQFWDTFDTPDEKGLKEKFIELWRLLPDLYRGLRENLEADGLALAGTAFRRAMERMEAEGVEALEWSRVVAVGFNMLSTTEARLFTELRGSQSPDGDAVGEFMWDATGPVLAATELRDGAKNPATVAMGRNLKNFPMPEWALPYISLSETRMMPPSLTECAAPSNVAQVKIASLRIGEWLADARESHREMRDARLAVVIPDENLLLPLVHSLPPGIETLNLTMGYSMRYTSVASFVHHMHRLQSRARRVDGQPAYYHEDLRLFMSHPLVQVLCGHEEANAVNNAVAEARMRVVPLPWLAERSPEGAAILKPLSSATSAPATIAYIDDVLSSVYVALGNREERRPGLDSDIERLQIDRYRQALMQLLLCVQTHGVEMHFSSVFRMVDRLVAGERITFEGEPLEGLQIMGLLETRALDFEKLIILSMNDKVMPQRSRKRTFIPDSLRRGYGLPLSNQAEELYSYYFYRLVSRAREVTLIYDARAGEGMRSGGKSRFLLQLEMLYARNVIKNKAYTFHLESRMPKANEVVKTDAVMERLEDFKSTDPGRKRNLSASALMNYCKCQVLFFYKNVMHIHDEEEHTTFMDAITQGTVIHEVMLRLYFPKALRKKLLAGSRIVLSRESLQALLEDEERISRTVRRVVNREFFGIGRSKGVATEEEPDLDRELPAGVAMVAARLEKAVKEVIRHDLRHAPLELLGGEVEGEFRWKAGDAPEVNIRYAFDRVDICDGRVRVADYKTGGSGANASSGFDEIFSGNYKSKYILQLLLYSNWLASRLPEGMGEASQGVAMAILAPSELATTGAIVPSIGTRKEKRKLATHLDAEADFATAIEAMVKEIFNPDIPFRPTPRPEEHCTACTLATLCGRI